MWPLVGYLSNIKTIGIHKARLLVKKENFVDELGKYVYATANYKESFVQARSVFQHQLVYNINTKKVGRVERKKIQKNSESGIRRPGTSA